MWFRHSLIFATSGDGDRQRLDTGIRRVRTLARSARRQVRAAGWTVQLHLRHVGSRTPAARRSLSGSSSSGRRGSSTRAGRRFGVETGSGVAATPGHAAFKAAAKSSGASNRSPGSSASARANTSWSAPRSVPGILVRLSAAGTPRPLTRRPHISSCISAARLKTSARRSQSAPAIRSGAVYGRRTGATTPIFPSARVTPRPVSRVSSDESSTSRGCSAPCVTCAAAARSSAPARCAATRNASPGGSGPVLANGQVERIGGDVVLGEKRGYAADPGAERRRERGMRQLRARSGLEFGDQLMGAFGRQVEFEQLDGDKALAR